MRVATAGAIALGIVLTICLSPGAAAADAPLLKLKAAQFDPLAGPPELPEERTLSETPSAGYFIVQLDRRITAGLLDRVRDAGAEPVGYLPERAYFVRLDEGAAAAVRALPFVRWLGPVQPGFKLAPDLGSRHFVDPRRREGGRLYATADLFAGEDDAPVIERLAELGAEYIQTYRFSDTVRVKFHATLEQAEALAHHPAVQWIEEWGEMTPRNNTTRWVIQENVPDTTPIWDHGLHGEGQIIGHIDNRLGIQNCWFRDPEGDQPGPNHRKIVAYRSNSGIGASSHGTHTAATSVGDQIAINGTDNHNGHAYAAKVSHGNNNDITGFGNTTSNFYQYLTFAHEDGARLHTNSWGDDGQTGYTTWARDIDRFSYDFEESLVLFAVTNAGNLRTPENAKDVLAVGATNGGTGANNHCTGGDGPTNDGRRKPEIYVPGCGTVSARNDSGCNTSSQSGTSMACPAVTGAGALVRQYLTEGWYPTGTPNAADAIMPSGALLKAILLNGTVDMTGVAGYPSNREGWGRLVLERTLFFEGDPRQSAILADIFNADGLGTGGETEYTLTVEGSGEQLKITLVFTEPPAELNAGSATVNNLDLEVVSPSGNTYFGNSIDTGTGLSILGGSADGINNVEMAIFDNPEVGEWTLRVKGTAVNEGTQGYALVASGNVKPATAGSLRYQSHTIDDSGSLGNNDGLADPGETITMPLTLRNATTVDVTGITVDLVDDQGEVKLTGAQAVFPDIPAEQSGQSLAPHFRYTIQPGVACGTRIRFTGTTASSGDDGELNFVVAVGNDLTSGAAADLPIQIPKRDLTGVTSTLDITDSFTLKDVQATVRIDHGDVGELIVRLAAPDGTNVTMHNKSRPGEANIDTTYDRDTAADGPGTMNDFNGKNAQGTWTLTVIDDTTGPTPKGTIVSFSLELQATVPLSCNPLDCGGDPIPGEVASVLVDRSGSSDVEISWGSVAGADGYRVYRSATPDFGVDEFVGSTSGLSLIDAGAQSDGLAWYYRVRATNACEWEGP